MKLVKQCNPRLLLASLVCCCVFGITASAQTTIHVPADQPTIQAGINAASNGDTVLVADGTYHEHINFNGKNITVTSTNGPAVTIIDGDIGAGPVVRFISNEGRGAVLHGFTIQHGSVISSSGNNEGGGIEINGASPTILKNTITLNDSAVYGGGINAFRGAPVIDSNTISNNTISVGLAKLGGGISVREAPATPLTRITHNTITGHQGIYWGAGIHLDFSPQTLVANNLIANNSASSQGRGIYAVNGGGETILQNIVTGNFNGGIFIAELSGSPGFKVVNNTIANNPGGELVTDGFDANAQIENNIIFNADDGALVCGWAYHFGPPIVRFNDVFSGLGVAFAYFGDCTGMSGTNGNIFADPLFVSSSDFHLLGGSPAIDAGDNFAPGLPSLDFDLNPRIVDGHLSGTAVIDMGAYEMQPFFTVSAAQPSTVTMINGAVSVPITFQVTGSILGTVTLSCPGAPTGVSCGFLPSANIALAPGRVVTVTMNIFTSPNTALGTQSITLSGSANGIVAPQTQTITLNVNGGTGTTDLLLSATHSSDPVRVGGVIAVTFTVNNIGQDATGVHFNGLASPVLSTSALPSQGGGCSIATFITCNLGPVAHGGTATVTVMLTPGFVRSTTITGIVNSEQSDTNPSNNIQSSTTQVRLRPRARK